MGRTAKLTISLPEELIAFADEIARKKKTSRSKVFSSCLKEMAEAARAEAMIEGYKALAKENKQFAEDSIKIAHEVLPGWE